jgi:predicted chitinase/uncharacterized Zn-binding protein involved in type VI secretion
MEFVLGKPAGRLGDVSTHGGTLILGAPNVLIGKMPAGTLGDMHVCPMVTGVVPHVGGPVALGSMGVLLGKKPAARVSDLSPCVGPPDMLAMGCMTVLIGEAGGAGGGGSAAAAAAAAAAKQNGPKAIKPYVPIEPAEPRTENHYVECNVVDSANLPLQGLRYKLTDPDGQKVIGAVAAGGRIRHDGYSQAGSFKVEFTCLANVKWSKTKSKPGEKLTLKADADGFENGTACPIMIFEVVGNGTQRLLKTLTAKIQGNQVSGEWSLTQEELAKVEPEGPQGKVEYFFIMVADGIVGVSDRMQCLDDAKVELIDPDEKPLAEAKYELHLRDGSVRSGKADKQGKAEQKDIPAGPYTIVLPEIVIHGRVPKTEKPGAGPDGGAKAHVKTRQKPKPEKKKVEAEEPEDGKHNTNDQVILNGDSFITEKMLMAGNDVLNNADQNTLLLALNKYAKAYEVNTPVRISHFLSQIGHESGFKATEENLRYSEIRMKQIFGCKAGCWKDGDCPSEDRRRPKLWSEPENYAFNPQNLANYVYADRLGNGNEASGDGYKYRGRGLIQLTGKSNYKKYTEVHNLKNPDSLKNFVANPDLIITEIEFSIESAFAWWEMNSMNGLCVDGNAEEIKKISTRVNGGTIGLEDRTSRYHKIRAEFRE